MVLHIPSTYLHQTPLLAILIIPLISAFYGLRKINLKSPIHFQQGTIGATPWRIAVTMSLLSIPPFAVWCLLVPGPSSIFFLLGNSLAVPLSLLSATPILHYIPSPSLTQYIQSRFQANTLRICLSLLHCLVSLVICLFLLCHSASLVVSVSQMSFYLVCPLLACVSLVSIIFSGHSTIMTPTLPLYVLCVLAGLGVFLYFAIEDVTSFNVIVPLGYSIPDCAISFVVGLIFTLYYLSSSPAFYQVYFPIPTLHKLRLSYIFFGVFHLMSSVFVFLVSSLFIDFLEKHCNLQYSYSSLFQFIKFTIPHQAESYLVVCSLLCVLLFCLQWQLLSLATHLWEEFAKTPLRNLTARRQLWTLQILLLTLTVFLFILSCALRLLKIPYSEATPTVMLVMLTLCCISCGIYLCGYLLPCTNRKGGAVALVVCLSLSIALFTLHLSHNDMPQLTNSCTKEVSNVTVVIRSFNMEKLLVVTSQIPLHAHPIIAFVVSMLVCVTVSFLTGGQDQMSLDWNLVICPCTSLLKGRSSTSKRSFVESESFRYAQHEGIYR